MVGVSQVVGVKSCFRDCCTCTICSACWGENQYLKLQSDTGGRLSEQTEKIHLPLFLSVGWSQTLTGACVYMLITF